MIIKFLENQNTTRFKAEKLAAGMGGRLISHAKLHDEVMAGRIEMRAWAREFVASPGNKNVSEKKDFVDAKNGLVLPLEVLMKAHEKAKNEGKEGILGVNGVVLFIDPQGYENLAGDKKAIVPSLIVPVYNAVKRFGGRGVADETTKLAVYTPGSQQVFGFLKKGIGALVRGGAENDGPVLMRHYPVDVATRFPLTFEFRVYVEMSESVGVSNNIGAVVNAA